FTSTSQMVAVNVPICLSDVTGFGPAFALTSRLRCSRSIPAITSGAVRRMNLISRQTPAGQCFPIIHSSWAINFRLSATQFRAAATEWGRGHRRYNLGWSRVAAAARLRQMCVDDHGREFEFGVPPPLVRKDLISQMRAEAETLLPPQYLDCLRHIDQPFFTPV